MQSGQQIAAKTSDFPNFESFLEEGIFNAARFQAEVVNSYSANQLIHLPENYFRSTTFEYDASFFLLTIDYLTTESIIQILKRLPAENRKKILVLENIPKMVGVHIRDADARVLLLEKLLQENEFQLHEIINTPIVYRIIETLSSPRHTLKFLLALQEAGNANNTYMTVKQFGSCYDSSFHHLQTSGEHDPDLLKGVQILMRNYISDVDKLIEFLDVDIFTPNSQLTYWKVRLEFCQNILGFLHIKKIITDDKQFLRFLKRCFMMGVKRAAEEFITVFNAVREDNNTLVFSGETLFEILEIQYHYTSQEVRIKLYNDLTAAEKTALIKFVTAKFADRLAEKHKYYATLGKFYVEEENPQHVLFQLTKRAKEIDFGYRKSKEGNILRSLPFTQHYGDIERFLYKITTPLAKISSSFRAPPVILGEAPFNVQNTRLQEVVLTDAARDTAFEFEQEFKKELGSYSPDDFVELLSDSNNHLYKRALAETLHVIYTHPLTKDLLIAKPYQYIVKRIVSVNDIGYTTLQNPQLAKIKTAMDIADEITKNPSQGLDLIKQLAYRLKKLVNNHSETMIIVKALLEEQRFAFFKELMEARRTTCATAGYDLTEEYIAAKSFQSATEIAPLLEQFTQDDKENFCNTYPHLVASAQESPFCFARANNPLHQVMLSAIEMCYIYENNDSLRDPLLGSITLESAPLLRDMRDEIIARVRSFTCSSYNNAAAEELAVAEIFKPMLQGIEARFLARVNKWKNDNASYFPGLFGSQNSDENLIDFLKANTNLDKSLRLMANLLRSIYEDLAPFLEKHAIPTTDSNLVRQISFDRRFSKVKQPSSRIQVVDNMLAADANSNDIELNSINGNRLRLRS